MAESDYDILIAGGGLVGLTLANLLADSGLYIAVLERDEPDPPGDELTARVSAINPAAAAIFQQLDCWSAMQARSSRVAEMRVWDSTGLGAVHFDSADIGEPALAYIIENAVVQHALLQRLASFDNVDWRCPAVIDNLGVAEGSRWVKLQSGERLQCRLLVGADGVRSVVRREAGIDYSQTAYDQRAIVCNVDTELPHQAMAWQCFTPTGPLAFLPLFQGSCSIVWSLDDSHVQRVLELEDEPFCRALESAFEYRLGSVLASGPRFSFALGHGHASAYVADGLALVGDAAHSIHPLAGQGANLGFLDAACLADVVNTALASGRRWHALHSLRTYERTRKGENLAMEAAMTAFKTGFGNSHPLLTAVRNSGLLLVDHAGPLKRAFMRHAMGLSPG